MDQNITNFSDVNRDTSLVKDIFLPGVILWTGLGTILFFCTYGILARGEGPFGSFIAASIGGAFGTWICSKWLKGIPSGQWARKVILVAYFARIVVGLGVYLPTQDPNYFSGSGDYVTQQREYYWTFDKALFAFENIKKYGDWNSRDVYLVDIDKNANIHTWMGWFLVAGDSRHSLDLAPFNSFHHVVAGLLISGIALALRYPQSVSLLAGVTTAWIPWAFPATLMWRDSVGLGWTVLSFLILLTSARYGIWAILVGIVPSFFLVYSNREVYILVLFVALSASLKSGWSRGLVKWQILTGRLLLLLMLAFVVLFYVFSEDLVFHRYEGFGFVLDRIFSLPLLFLRALAGPFPWFSSSFNYYTIFDYLYHVFQLAVLLVIINRWRDCLKNFDLLVLSGACFWLFALVAHGVHTAYLAVAIPFLLPMVFSSCQNFKKYLLMSFLIFCFLNTLYLLSGLHGSGFIMKATGY